MNTVMKKFILWKQFQRISPIETSTEFDIFEQECLENYTTRLPDGEVVLDVEKLPKKNSTKCLQLFQRSDFQQLFSQTVVQSLMDVENTFDSMFEESLEGFKTFIPMDTFNYLIQNYSQNLHFFEEDEEDILHTKYDLSIISQISEMDTIAMIFKKFHSSTNMKKNSSDVTVTFREVKELFRTLLNCVIHQSHFFQIVKGYIQQFYQQFSRKYSKSIPPALSLFKDFKISQRNLTNRKSRPTTSESAVNFYIQHQPSDISILSKCVPPNGNEWMRCNEVSQALQEAICNGLLNEAKYRVSLALKLLQASLIKTPSGRESQQSSLLHETEKLRLLFECHDLSLPKSSTTTIIFSFLRIQSTMDSLRLLLSTAVKHIKLTQTQFSALFNHKSTHKALQQFKMSRVCQVRTYTDWGSQTEIISTKEFQGPPLAESRINIGHNRDRMMEIKKVENIESQSLTVKSDTKCQLCLQASENDEDEARIVILPGTTAQGQSVPC